MTKAANLAALGTSNGNSVLVSGTAVASTSGTSIDFTGIPSWAKRITVMMNGVSTNGSTDYLVQIGSGSVTTSGYLTQRTFLQATGANSNGTYTNSMVILANVGASAVTMAHVVLTHMGSNVWLASATYTQPGSTLGGLSAGSITLGGVLDRVRITTSGGSDTFDAGSINIMYE
jgi:hypothetical protein